MDGIVSIVSSYRIIEFEFFANLRIDFVSSSNLDCGHSPGAASRP